uniref:Uncharacterized protein n=1 Tax=Anguilla anguilla TaxID=7936 RepID=A0A0E9Q7C6_ANGAN
MFKGSLPFLTSSPIHDSSMRLLIEREHFHISPASLLAIILGRSC